MIRLTEGEEKSSVLGPQSSAGERSFVGYGTLSLRESSDAGGIVECSRSLGPKRRIPSFFVVVFTLVTACGSSSEAPPASSNDDDAGVEQGNGNDDAGSGNDDAGSDVEEDWGEDKPYRQGVYTCCGKGQGRSCCPPATLPDPATGRTATCFQYGGVLGVCTVVGEVLDAKDICSKCCPGLTRVPSLVPKDDGPLRVGSARCEQDNYPSVFGCTACGNGVCGEGENVCNCPVDCQ